MNALDPDPHLAAGAALAAGLLAWRLARANPEALRLAAVGVALAVVWLLY